MPRRLFQLRQIVFAGSLILLSSVYSSSPAGERDSLASLLSRHNADDTGKIKLLLGLADIYYRDAKYEEAVELYSRVIPLSKKNHDLKTEGLALIDIGCIYANQASYPDAIDYYLKGLKVFEESKDDRGLSMTLVNIAGIYATVGNFTKAAEYLNKSLPITAHVTDKKAVFSNTVNAGIVYAQMKDLKRALDAFNRGLLMADSMKDKYWQNTCLINIADIYDQMGMVDSAYLKYQRLLKITEELADTSFIPIAKAAIGGILVKKGKYREAIGELLPALAVAQKSQMKQTIFDASSHLSDAYEQLHDYPNALKYHKIAYAYHDSLNSEGNGKKIQQLQFDYELGKRETQIELLQKDHIIGQNRARLQRIVIWSSLSSLCLVIIISILLYRNSRQTKLNNERIVKQKEEIELQASKLAELNQLKDKTFSVLSHDLRAPLGALTATIGLLDEQFITVDDFMRLKPDIQERLNAVNNLLDNLLNWARSYNKGNLIGPPQPVPMRDIIDNNIAILASAAARKNLNIQNNVSSPVVAVGFPGQLDIVIRNLLSNAIKFSRDNSNITFGGSTDNGKVTVTITDEGVGMTEAQINKLFQVSSNMSTSGTRGESGVGIGLLLCQEFVKANNGALSVVSSPDAGTTFTVSLPAYKPADQ